MSRQKEDGVQKAALGTAAGGPVAPSETRRPAAYYSDDLVTIYHGDAVETMRGLVDESVDIVVTSPPYNMGLVPGGNGRGMYRPGASNKAGRFRDGYGTHDDAMPQGEYDAWQRECLREMWRVARVAVFYVHRPRVEHGRLRLPLGMEFGPAVLRQIIVWDRGTGIDVNLRAFCTRQEWVLLFAKPDFKLVDHAASGMGDVWSLGMAYDEREHPAPFPVALPYRAIVATGARSVLDPFVGSGSTLVAAKTVGISGIGVDNDERWCRRAVARVSPVRPQSVIDWPVMESEELIDIREQLAELTEDRTATDPDDDWHRGFHEAVRRLRVALYPPKAANT